MYTQIQRLPKQDKPNTGGNTKPVTGHIGANVTFDLSKQTLADKVQTQLAQNYLDITNTTKPINDLITNITSKTTLLNIGGVVFGGVMIFLGLQSLLKVELLKTAKNAVGV